MSWRRSAAIAGNELRLLRADPMPVITLIFMPLVLMAFLKPAMQEVLTRNGSPQANGAEQVVPGMAVMFSFFLVTNVGFAFFREHGWNTWDRLRASHASTTEIMAAKVACPLLLSAFQFVVLFGMGRLLFGLNVRGSIVGVALIGACFSICLVSLGLAVAGICRTMMQLSAMVSLGVLVLAGLGGALLPLAVMPSWARAVAPATPSYWAMRGYSSIILDGAGLSDALLPAAVILMFAAGFLVIAGRSLRFADRKTSWA